MRIIKSDGAPVDAAFVRRLLQRSDGFEWSIQGFGMLRLYLSRSVRLHLWNPAAAVDEVTTIHTHPWDFDSYVIAGSIVDRMYRLTLDGPPYTHREERIVCGPGGCATGDKRDVHLRLMSERHVHAGDSYGLAADHLHESRPEPGTVSAIVRRFHADTEHAYVYAPVGQPWVSAEPRPATMREVRTFCDLALGALERVPDGT